MSLIFALAVAHAEPVVAIVVVDEAAREQGFALQLDGWLVEDALPVDVQEGETLHLVDADGRRELLDVAAGEAWEISGEGGEAWMSVLGEDVRTDLVAVVGDAEAVIDLATDLGVDVFREGQRYYLKGDGVLFDVPWTRARLASTIREVGLVGTDEVLTNERSAHPPVRPEGAHDLPRYVPARPVVASRTHLAGPTVTTLPRPLAEVAPVAAPEPAPVPAREVQEEPQPAVALVDSGRTVSLDGEAYAGQYRCRDEMLWLHPAGVFAFRGVTGTWTVSAPGVVRMYDHEGQLLAKAAIEADRHFCREAW